MVFEGTWRRPKRDAAASEEGAGEGDSTRTSARVAQPTDLYKPPAALQQAISRCAEQQVSRRALKKRREDEEVRCAAAPCPCSAPCAAWRRFLHDARDGTP